MFGGSGGTSKLGDTWRYDQTLTTLFSNRWTKCTGDVKCDPPSTDCTVTTNVPPCTRMGDRMAFYTDGSTTNEILMFGGVPGGMPTTLLNDTWLYSGIPGDWSVCDASNGCPSNPISPTTGRCCTGLTFDSKRDQIVLFGGQLLPQPHAFFDVWVWVPTPGTGQGWTCVTPSATCNSPT